MTRDAVRQLLAEISDELDDWALPPTTARSKDRLVAALTAVLDKHQPERRFQPGPDCMHSYDTPEDAARGEGIDLSSVTFFEVCAHCGGIEMGDENDRDYRESLWPCPTYRAVAAALQEQP